MTPGSASIFLNEIFLDDMFHWCFPMSQKNDLSLFHEVTFFISRRRERTARQTLCQPVGVIHKVCVNLAEIGNHLQTMTDGILLEMRNSFCLNDML